MNNLNDPVSSELRPENKAKKTLKFIWIVLIALGTFGTYASIYIPALIGRDFTPNSNFHSMIWTGLLFASIWKYKFKNGWVGLLIGAIVGMIIYILASIIRSYVIASSGT